MAKKWEVSKSRARLAWAENRARRACESFFEERAAATASEARRHREALLARHRADFDARRSLHDGGRLCIETRRALDVIGERHARELVDATRRDSSATKTLRDVRWSEERRLARQVETIAIQITQAERLGLQCAKLTQSSSHASVLMRQSADAAVARVEASLVALAAYSPRAEVEFRVPRRSASDAALLDRPPPLSSPSSSRPRQRPRTSDGTRRATPASRVKEAKTKKKLPGAQLRCRPWTAASPSSRPGVSHPKPHCALTCHGVLLAPKRYAPLRSDLVRSSPLLLLDQHQPVDDAQRKRN